MDRCIQLQASCRAAGVRHIGGLAGLATVAHPFGCWPILASRRISECAARSGNHGKFSIRLYGGAGLAAARPVRACTQAWDQYQMASRPCPT